MKENILLFSFILNLSLLFIHEMEAVRYREWKMFIILKEMNDSNAYTAFMLLHLPLYIFILLLLLTGYQGLGFILLDVFLILHALIHFGFRKHRNNGLTGALSKTIIYVMGLLAFLHICTLILIK